jgi:hypothetical protein
MQHRIMNRNGGQLQGNGATGKSANTAGIAGWRPAAEGAA